MSENPLGILVGREVDAVSFVRNYVELRIDYSILRALTNPTGTTASRGGSPTREPPT